MRGLVAFSLVLMLTIAMVQAALFPKLPKLVMKYENSDEDGDTSGEVSLFKLPKLNLFGKPTLKEKLADKEKLTLLDKLAAKKGKDTLLEKLDNKKEEKFEERMFDFFDDKDNVKTIFDKLQSHKLFKSVVQPEPEPEEKPCKCKERQYDRCDDEIRYFS